MSSRKGRPLHWTSEKVAELRARMEPWMRRQTADAFSFKITGEGGLAREFQVSDDVCHQIVRQLVEEGMVDYRGATHLGYSWRGAAGRAVTLADLVAFAAGKVDPAAAAEKGRRGLELRLLTESQFKDAKTVANLIAKNVPGAGGDLARVTGTWFGYDLAARAWELEAHVARWSDEQHRAGWERKAKEDGSTGVWSPKLNTGRSKHLGAVQNLLDLAATLEQIPRATRPEHKLRSPATEWQGPIRRMKARILRHDPTASARLLDVGLRTLTLVASRRRELSFRTTDWKAVRAEIEAMPDAAPGDTYVRQQRDSARYVWRRVAALLRRPSGPSRRVRMVVPAEYEWATIQDTRRSLVPDGAITGAAAHATDAAKGAVPFDYAATWTTRRGVYAQSFVEGAPILDANGVVVGRSERGMADWIRWSTLPADTLRRLKFPERAFINPPPEMLQGMKRAMGGDKQPYLLAFDTLVGRTRLYSQIAGWAQENPDVTAEMVGGRTYDFVARDDLAAICDLDLVLAYSEWVRDEGGDDGADEIAREGVPASVADLAVQLSKVATPYLEGRALKRAEALEKGAADRLATGDAPGAAGDAAAATAARAEAAAFRRAGLELRQWGYKHKPKAGAMYKEIVKIAAAWEGSSHRAGWLKLDDLVDLLLAEAEQIAGISVAEQLEAMRAAEKATPKECDLLLKWQSPAWSSTVRMAMLVNFVRKLPVRARALSEMRLEWWQATIGGKRVEAWADGATIQARIPASAMKTKEDYQPFYIRPENVGDDAHERGARRHLVELWLRPLGAREYALTEWREQTVEAEDGSKKTERVRARVVESTHFFPASASYGNGGKGAGRAGRLEGGLRWAPASLSTAFAQAVREHAAALQIDLETLEQMQGGLRIHVARLLFGHHNAPLNLVDTSLMLHHSDEVITAKLYVGRSASSASFEAHSGANRGESTAMRALHRALEQAQQTNEELRAALVAAQTNAQAGGADMIALLRESLAEQRRANEMLQEQNRQMQQRLDKLLGISPAA